MRTLYLVRGVPGSGKSTLAAQLGAELIEADQFFMDNGEYRFNAAKLPYAHQWCQDTTLRKMASRKDKIAVANTFTLPWELRPYLEMAVCHNYQIVIIECTGKFENVHGVPEEKVEQMRVRFVPNDGLAKAFAKEFPSVTYKKDVE